MFQSYIVMATIKITGVISPLLYVFSLHSIFITAIYHFLINHSFTFPRPLSSLCHHQSTMRWSHAIPSPYHLLFLHPSTSSSSSLSPPPPPAITEITTPLSFLLNHTSYIFPSSSRLLISCQRHRPLAAFLVFIILIISLIISPTGPEAQYLYVLDALYSIKSRMLMQQKAAEHYGEWTNFRSAWPRFITAHKPKVSCVR